MRKNRKIGLTGLLLGILLVSAMLVQGAPVFAADLNMYVDPVSQTVSPGASFSVQIRVSTDIASRSAQCDVQFDPSLIQVNSVTEGTFYSGWASAHGGATYWQPPTIDNAAGLIDDAAISLTGAKGQGVTGSGTFIVINMQAKAGVNGTSAITLVETIIGSLDHQGMTHTAANGAIVVGQTSGPDLVVSDKHEEWIEGSAGTYNISYTITNQGTGAAEASTTEVDIDGAKTTYVCPALAAGASDTQSVGPFTLSGNQDVITVTADINGQVAESNEGNNVRQNTLMPGVMIIEGNLKGSLILVTVPASIYAWDLQMGDNQKAGTLNVKSNGNWQVAVSDQDAATAGHMTEWNGSQYGFNRLHSQMVVACSSENTSVGLESSGIIASGAPEQQQGDAGESFDLSFNQTVQTNDTVLTGDSVYRIVITFTGAVTF